MSRIQIPAEDVLNDAHVVWVGWDSPLESFFGQVYDVLENHYGSGLPQDGPDDPVIFWAGTSCVGEIPTVPILVDVMSPYCKISSEVQTQLLADYNNRTTPTPLHDIEEFVTRVLTWRNRDALINRTDVDPKHRWVLDL
jgi:hypothetical protein